MDILGPKPMFSTEAGVLPSNLGPSAEQQKAAMLAAKAEAPKPETVPVTGDAAEAVIDSTRSWGRDVHPMGGLETAPSKQVTPETASSSPNLTQTGNVLELAQNRPVVPRPAAPASPDSSMN